MKAFHIDATAKTISVVEYEGLADLQKMVGGNIELAYCRANGDAVFVDDEGLFKYRQFFTMPDGHQPFAGNGVIVGREFPGSSRTRPPRSTLEELQRIVKFFDHAQMHRGYGTA